MLPLAVRAMVRALVSAEETANAAAQAASCVLDVIRDRLEQTSQTVTLPHRNLRGWWRPVVQLLPKIPEGSIVFVDAFVHLMSLASKSILLDHEGLDLLVHGLILKGHVVRRTGKGIGGVGDPHKVLRATNTGDIGRGRLAKASRKGSVRHELPIKRVDVETEELLDRLIVVVLYAGKGPARGDGGALLDG